MKGKNFIIYLGLFLSLFTIFLFLFLYQNGWFDIFIESGFKGLYGEK